MKSTRYIVEDKMSKNLITAHVDEGMPEAYSKLRQNKIRHLPVIDDVRQVVGVISDRDFHRAMVLEKYEDTYMPSKNVRFIPGAKVCNFMSWPIETINHLSTLAEVSRIMIERKISALLISDEQNIIGIITHEDLLRVLVDLLTPSPTGIQKITQWTYTSPIGTVINTLGNIGV